MGFFNKDKGKANDSELKRLLSIRYDSILRENPTSSEMVINSIRSANKTDVTIENEPHPTDLPSALVPSMSETLYVIILEEKEGNRYLPIWIGAYEASTISIALQGNKMPRPLTHDFLCSIIGSFGASVEFVVIDELKDECWYAKTIINYGRQLKAIDCRPSDALALAVRTGSPIYTTEEILEKAGTNRY
jgi:bifunctional DNase/RNase